MSYISPRISIVDGTHLCLLPSFNAVSNVSGGGSKSEKNQQTYVANYDMHHTNVEGQAINIPAVPLSSICNIYSGECIPCSDVDTAGNTNIDTMRPQISASSSADKNNLHKLPIETIQIHTSDISNTQYRFIHSTSLNNNNDSTASNLPLRVVVCGVSDEGIISVNNKRVKVTLPSFTTSNEHLVTQYGNEDDCKVYGGENYNIVDGDVANGMQGGNSNNKSRQSIEVQGAGSCLVADFLGIVGYEQALVLPQVSSELLSKQGSTNMNDVESIQQQKELLQMILRHSFLTDGNGILFPKSYASNKTNLTTTKADDDKSMILLTMLPLERLEEDEIAVDEEGSPNDGGSDLMTKEGDASAQHPTKSITIDTQPTDTCNNISSQEDPEWLKLIAQTVEHRLSKQQEESNQIERSAQARIDLVNQGRRTLHAANRPMNHSAKCIDWNNDPMVFRLRYGVRPRTSNHGGGGISVVMDLELDILMPYGGGSEQGTTNSSSSITNTVHDFHISCSLTSNNMKNNQSTTTPENIRTSSGVVPTLQSGDCITMLASICLEDLKISMNDDDNSTLDISIQGLWVDDAASSSIGHSTRRGAVLCILRLPIDSLFLSPPMLSSQQRSGGQWIQHEIDFTSNDNNQRRYSEPNVIVDYRQPRTLTIDTSNEMNSTNAKMWKDLVSNLNASIGGSSSYIDLYCKKDDPRLKMVIFSSNPEERVAVVKLVLRSLPESAKLIVDEEGGGEEEKQSVKALLMSLKKEAETLKRHRATLLSSSTIKQGGVVQEDLLTEMMTLQCDTDGIASTIKRGWM